ncbi:5-oxoprolinase subunit PxpB [Bacillus sp. D386]|uniref:5-oxoprolinase subunit PxpB n=1 Tax=Bacillus sp. D386 TaxID=2587155 RepID=UPI0011234CA1|nr:5-oxoprolinase subunit PxpB [Bacillus sp. D386]
MNYSLHPLGDRAILIEFGKEIDEETYNSVRKISNILESEQPEWLIEVVPAYTTLTLFYSPEYVYRAFQESRLPYEIITSELKRLLDRLQPSIKNEQRRVKIPICYGGEYGPDLVYVAKYNYLTEQEVIEIHSSGDYLIYMLGFAPGFPYIGGMSKEISAPRRKSPRQNIPPGTVGIAGEQTGIYPIETPGGWQLIGRTPLKLFNPTDSSPTLLQAGDRVQFKPISHEEYVSLEGERQC